MFRFNNDAGSAGGFSHDDARPSPSSNRGRTRSDDFGLPGRPELLELARTYLETQARLWPDVVGTVAVPEISEATLKTMAESFERQFRQQAIDVFQPGRLRKIWLRQGPARGCFRAVGIRVRRRRRQHAWATSSSRHARSRGRRSRRWSLGLRSTPCRHWRCSTAARPPMAMVHKPRCGARFRRLVRALRQDRSIKKRSRCRFHARCHDSDDQGSGRKRMPFRQAGECGARRFTETRRAPPFLRRSQPAREEPDRGQHAPTVDVSLSRRRSPHAARRCWPRRGSHCHTSPRRGLAHGQTPAAASRKCRRAPARSSS